MILLKKPKKNLVSVSENVISTKLKFNFLKFLTMIKISISQFSIKSLSLNDKLEENFNRERFINISLLKFYPTFPLKVKKKKKKIFCAFVSKVKE